MKNEGKLEHKRRQLREARKNLQSFENDFDSYMPKNESFWQFREKAKRLLEGPVANRDYVFRTDEEDERLLKKIRKMQQENKEIDYTALFNSERADRLRRRQHKRAFKTYKAHEFLKAGIRKPKAEAKGFEAMEKMRTGDYRYPGYSELAADLYTDKMQLEIQDHGEMIDTRGRRFQGYSIDEIEAAATGRDGLRVGPFHPELPAFGFNDNLKNMYPKEDYVDEVTYPQMLKDMRKLHFELKDDYGMPTYDSQIHVEGITSQH